MAQMTIRLAEGRLPDSNALWDSVWNKDNGLADFAMADADEAANRGGLRAKSAIETAIALALFTDKRIDLDHPLYFLADGDNRGYFGDGVDVRDDLHERPLGSHLWLLERAPLTIRGLSAARWAEQFANEALVTLIEQGVAVRLEVSAVANELQSRLELSVALYGRDGSKIYDRNFDVLWNQVAR